LLQEAAPAPAIHSPRPGEALQGNAPVIVTTAHNQFQKAELFFAYANDLSGTWFLLAESTQPSSEQVMTIWNTTGISDGAYDLRLVVILQDGKTIEAIVHGLRVRNYTLIETDTPTPAAPTETSAPGVTPEPTQTSTPTITPTPEAPTPLPTNPAVITQSNMLNILGKGVLTTFGLFLLLGFYLTLRKLLHERSLQ
jgi:hypothetical protein